MPVHLAVNNTAAPVSVLYYNGNTTTASIITGATTETAGGSRDTHYAVDFGNNYIYTFVGQGVWRSPDNAITWELVYTPPSLTATNSARAGPFNVTVNGVTSLCCVYNTSSNGWRVITTTNGIDWTAGSNFVLGDNAINSPIVIDDKLYALNYSGTDLYLYTFSFSNNFAYSQLIASDAAVSTARLMNIQGSGVLPNGKYVVYYKTLAPTGLVLLGLNLDTTITTWITPSISLTLDSTADGTSFYNASNDSIYTLQKVSGSGVVAHKTTSLFDGWVDNTAAIIPSPLQTNTAANRLVLVQTAPPEASNLDLYLYARNSVANDFVVCQWYDTTYTLRFSVVVPSVGNTTNSLPTSNNLDSFQIRSNFSVLPELLAPPKVTSISLATGPGGVPGQVTVTQDVYCPTAAVAAQLAYSYAEASANNVNNPATISATDTGTFSGNTVTFTASPGFTTVKTTWNLSVDFPGDKAAKPYLINVKLDSNGPTASRNQRAATGNMLQT